MTVPVPDKLEYISVADGTTRDFPYPKRFLQANEIVVLLRDIDGTDTPQYLGQHFAISGSSWPNGGTVSFYSTPAAGLKVVRYRMTQAKQTVDLENKQRNDAKAVETQLDRLTMVDQDQVRFITSINSDLLKERVERIAGDLSLDTKIKVETAQRIAGDALLQGAINIESAQRKAADLIERNARIAGDDALKHQIDGIIPAVTQLTNRAEAAAENSEASAQTAQDLVEAAVSGSIGFQPGIAYDFGWTNDESTYFDRDFGSLP